MRDETVERLVIGMRQFEHIESAYVARNRELLGCLGDVVNVPRARALAGALLWRLVTFRRLKIYDVLILNWAENVLTQWHGKLTLRGILEYRLYLWICRRLSRGLVYVRHNRLPHNAPAADAARLTALIETGQRYADAVVTLSPVYAGESGCHYVPHPLFDLPLEAGQRDDEYVVFGRVQRYKNIDTLVEAWNLSSRLCIVGPCDDPEYLAELRRLATDKPVHFDIGFKDEGDVARRVGACAGVIIGNDPGSAIVSGTFFFALSCGAPVFAVETPFYDWVATTPLAPAVRACASIPELVDGIGGRNPAHAPGASSIRAAAEALFGDEQVIEAWRAVFESLPSPETEGARADA
jgi:glycosyltransferase involved in cell wall biosynthesis